MSWKALILYIIRTKEEKIQLLVLVRLSKKSEFKLRATALRHSFAQHYMTHIRHVVIIARDSS